MNDSILVEIYPLLALCQDIIKKSDIALEANLGIGKIADLMPQPAQEALGHVYQEIDKAKRRKLDLKIFESSSRLYSKKESYSV